MMGYYPPMTWVDRLWMLAVVMVGFTVFAAVDMHYNNKQIRICQTTAQDHSIAVDCTDAAVRRMVKERINEVERQKVEDALDEIKL